MLNAEISLYPYTYVYNGKLRTLLWAPSDGGDCFLRDRGGALFSAGSFEDAKVVFCNLQDRILWDEAAFVDVDSFWKEIDLLDDTTPTDERACVTILAGWNFIEDILRTFAFDELRKKLDSELVNKAYKKLFYGNNIDAVTPEGFSYSPDWDMDELKTLKSSLRKVWREIGNKTDLLATG